MRKTRKGEIGRRKRWVTVLVAALLSLVTLFGVFQLGCVYAENTWEYWQPDYAQEDIEELVKKEELSTEEYELLYRQTG